MTLHAPIERDFNAPEPDDSPRLQAVPSPRGRDAETPPRPAPRKAVQRRLPSVDAFRGLTILGMLLVNNVALGRFTPVQLVHAGWGDMVTFADMIFPWFLLIVGLSIPLAAASHRKRGLSHDVWMYKVFTRTFMLALLGCLVDSSVKGHVTFTLGVLQLIGLSYLVAALLAHYSQGVRLAVAAGLFLTHWAIVRFYPTDFGVGNFSASGNFVLWLNDTYLKTYHIDGLFSMVSTSALVLIGTIMGDALRREEGIELKEIGYLFVTGLILSQVGRVWATDTFFNKPMWTSSYLLFSGGLGLMVLAFFRLTLDYWGEHWNLKIGNWSVPAPAQVLAFPLLVFGANAITVYVMPILAKMLVMQRVPMEVAQGDMVPVYILVTAAIVFMVIGTSQVIAKLIAGPARQQLPGLLAGLGAMVMGIGAGAWYLMQKFPVIPDGTPAFAPMQQAWTRWWVMTEGHIGGGWGYTLSYIAVWWVVLLVMHWRKMFIRV